MPGKPSKINNTFIFITGRSGSGKTTIANFIQKDRKNITSLYLDRFYTNNNMKEFHDSSVNKIDKPYEHIGSITKILLSEKRNVKKFLDNISCYVVNNAKSIFKKKSENLILIEGYSLNHEEIISKIISELKLNFGEIYCWNLCKFKNE